MNRNLAIGTTFNKRIYDSKYQTVVDSVNKYYSNNKFFVYHENWFEDSIGNGVINLDEIDTKYKFDIFKEFDWFEDFLKSSPFSDCHKFGKRGTFDPPNYWKRNSIYWFRKVASIQHFIQNNKSGILLWLGADTFFTKELDDTVLNYVLDFDVCSIFRVGVFPDTDIMFFNLNNREKCIEFSNELLNRYLSLEIFKKSRWDDCQAFHETYMKTNEYIKYGGLSKNFGAPFGDIYDYIGHYKRPLHHIRDAYRGI